jgi:peptidoglycan/LPS O-acetylase OafA/YrhL
MQPAAEGAAIGSPLPLRQIPALTGLRFFAAFFILFAHSVDWLFRFDSADVRAIVNIVASGFAMYGMPLFFVLSGFVIHYNYYRAFRSRPFLRATCEFAAARAARLLPLYFALLFIAIFADRLFAKTQHNPMLMTEIIAYYATLTQSWWYVVLEQRELINWLFPLSWSISTEVFFYIAFVPAIFAILVVKTQRQALLVAIAYAAGVMASLTVIHLNMVSVLEVTEAHVPNYIGLDNFGESFYRWAFYFSPYTRVFEFFMGCLAAQAFVVFLDRPIGRAERRMADVALLAALLFLVGLGLCRLGLIDAGRLVYGSLSFLGMNFLFAPAIAVILFYVARYGSSPFTRFMSSSPLVAVGERSYSIYLVHGWTVPIFAQATGVFDWLSGTESVMRVLCAIALTLVFAHATYQLIEVPSRAWLRKRSDRIIARRFEQKIS